MMIEWRDDEKYVCLLEEEKMPFIERSLKKRRREENIKEKIRQEEDGGGKRKQK